MAELERRRIVQRAGRFADRLRDALPPVSGIHAPQARTRVEQRATAFIVEIHALGTHQHARVALEIPIRREWKPEGGEIVLQPGGWASPVLLGTHVVSQRPQAKLVMRPCPSSWRCAWTRFCEVSKSAPAPVHKRRGRK